MAHGTGHYWEPIYEADIEKSEYVVMAERCFYYYHESMSDDPRPERKATNEYEIRVIKWRTSGKRNRKVADLACEYCKTGSISRETAAMIWKNLRDKDISYNTCKAYFAQLKEVEK